MSRSRASRGGDYVLAISNAWPPMANGTGFALQALVRDLPRLVAIVPRAEGAGHSDPPWVRRKLRFSGRAGGPFKVFSLLQHAELLAAPLAWCLVHPRPALLVCSQPVFAGVAGRLVSAIFGVPYVVLGLGEEFTTLRHDRSPFQIRLRLLRAALRGASAVVCIAQHTRALVSDLYGVPSAKLPVIYPSVDVAEFASADEHAAQDLRRELAGAGPMVLMVGRLAETHKGFDRAIESWPDVLAGSPGAVLVIVGPGPQAPLAALARARGIADQVRFLGKVPRTTLLALYQACDVFLLPGREVAGSAEGFGVVFLEAALAGKPVVAGCVGGAREAVADGVTGLLVDGDSPADISGAVCRLLNEPGFAATLGAAGRRRVLQEFDGSRQRSAFATLVRELAGTGAAE